MPKLLGIDEVDKDPEVVEYKKFAAEELKKEVTERWKPDPSCPLASRFYGSAEGKTAIVIGTGHSLDRVEDQLKEDLGPNIVTVGVNAAVTRVPLDYWLFCDYDAYWKWRNKANDCEILGVDRFWPIYDDKVNIWQRGFSEDQILKEGRLFHQNTSALPAIHFAFKLGCKRVVTIGMDCHVKPGKKFDDDDPYIKHWGGKEKYIQVMNFTFIRICASIQGTLQHWKPEGVELVDASWGLLPLEKVSLKSEIEKAKHNGLIIPETADGRIIRA